jgi:hypothetical protein
VDTVKFSCASLIIYLGMIFSSLCNSLAVHVFEIRLLGMSLPCVVIVLL